LTSSLDAGSGQYFIAIIFHHSFHSVRAPHRESRGAFSITRKAACSVVLDWFRFFDAGDDLIAGGKPASGY
jgi:hypothetical protein